MANLVVSGAVLGVAITGCGRAASEAVEPSPVSTGVLVEGKSPSTSATVRFAREDKSQWADYSVSVYAPRKLDSDDAGVTMPYAAGGEEERTIEPGFLCRDFSAATDAVIPVIWQLKTSENGSGELISPSLDIYPVVPEDYGVTDIQIVGLTGKCKSFKTNGEMFFLQSSGSYEHAAESSEASLIVLKGYYDRKQPTSQPEVWDDLTMTVRIPPSIEKSWVSQISGAPARSLRTTTEFGCANKVLIPLSANPTPRKDLTAFACPELVPGNH